MSGMHAACACELRVNLNKNDLLLNTSKQMGTGNAEGKWRAGRGNTSILLVTSPVDAASHSKVYTVPEYQDTSQTYS